MRRALVVLALLLALLAPAAAAKSSLQMELHPREQTVKPQYAVAFLGNFSAPRPTRVVFEIVAIDGRGIAPVPNPVTTMEGRKVSIPFTVQSPYENGYVDETTHVTYRATPQDGSGPLEFTVTLHTRGLYVPAPPLAPLLGVLAVAAVAFARRVPRD